MSTLPGDTPIAGAATAPCQKNRVQSLSPSAPRLRSGYSAHAADIPSIVRADEIWLVVLAAFVGFIAGVAVWMMAATAQLIHEMLFAIGPDLHLSAMVAVDPVRAAAVPTLGGLLLGLSGLVIVRYRPRRSVDPIEANALYGGRMSLNDSLIIVGQTLVSNGVGASVGLEAGYTQIGSAMSSRLGRMFRVQAERPAPARGCGAAAAIAGAFNTPLAGAFYAFELVIGTYSLGTFAPVAVAAIVAVAVVNALGAAPFDLVVRSLALRCAGLHPHPAPGHGLRPGWHRPHAWRDADRRAIPQERRPELAPPGVWRTGGGFVGSYGPSSAFVRAWRAGRGDWSTVFTALHGNAGCTEVACLGYLNRFWLSRRALFRLALTGALVGNLFAGALAAVSTAHAVSPVVCALVGMSSLAVAIIGGPLTMGFLALESTGSLPLTLAVMAASVISALTVRRTFGYSFATWRFHLRGEAIRSAVDIGWMRSLTVGRMMRREMRTVRAGTPIAAFKRDFPLGARERVVVIDEDDRYGHRAARRDARRRGREPSRKGPAASHRHSAAATDDDDQGGRGDVRKR